jgi:hypothetical protein
MIDRFRALEKKYGNVHSHLDLVAIENLAIPVTKIEIEVLGQQIDEILPTTEFILRFTDIGINTVESLSEALGFDKLLVENLIALEESTGNVTFTASSSEIKITPQGRETLRTKMAASPKVTTKSLVFDNTLWELAPWSLQEFTPKSTLDKAKVEYNAVQKKSKSRVTQADLDVTLINRELARQSRNSKFEVHQLHRVISRKAGFKIAEIMVFYSKTGEREFLVIVNDERSVEHEQFIKKIGGLGNLGFEFEQIPEEEFAVTKQIVEVIADLPQSPDDGGPVAPYEHAPWLESALENSTKRLFIMSPWVHERVVNKQFLESVERLLEKKVEVVIAWGFGTDKETEVKKSSIWPLEQMLKLSKKYPKNFKYIKMNESHAKVLISDDVYIATSFNWLSFMGDKRRKYRTEIGEMRTLPSVVQKRFDFMMNECQKYGQPMNDSLIPR